MTVPAYNPHKHWGCGINADNATGCLCLPVHTREREREREVSPLIANANTGAGYRRRQGVGVLSAFVGGNQKPPKWPINSVKHSQLARQAAMVVLYKSGIYWSGSPTNTWLSEQIGEDIFNWWSREGRALCSMSGDERIFDRASWG